MISGKHTSGGGLLGGVLLILAVAGCESRRQPDPQFTSGRTALARGQYQSAIETLDGYLQQHRKSRLASRASFLIGKAQLGLGNHDAARGQFERTIENYGDSEEAHKSHYKLAVLSLIEGDRTAARQRFERLVTNPAGPLVPESAMMLRYLDEESGTDRDAEQAAAQLETE